MRWVLETFSVGAERAWAWMKAGQGRRLLGGSWLEALLAGLLLFLAVFYLNARLFPYLSTVLLGARHYDNGDGGGIFIYWWTWHALVFDKSPIFFDMVCAPGGRGLHLTFPNRLEAYLGVPFYQLFQAPLNHNLFMISMFALNSWPAYLLFRSLRVGRIASLIGALLFGYNAYSIHEVRMGRPVTGFVLWFPLALWPIQRAMQAPGWRAMLGWALLAGLAVSWAVEAYVVFAVYVILGCVVLGVGALVWPAPGVSRSRPVLVAVVAGLASVIFSAPYVYEVERILPGQLVQAMEGRPQETRPALWEPRLWKGLAEQVSSKYFISPVSAANARSNLGTEYRVHRDALAWTWLWEQAPPPLERKAYIPRELWGAALLLALFGGRSGVICLGLGVLGYALTLGSFISVWDAQDSLQVVLWEGQRLVLPTHSLLELIPRLLDFLRPYRAFPLVQLGVAGLFAAGLHGLACWVQRRAWPGEQVLRQGGRALLARLGSPWASSAGLWLELGPGGGTLLGRVLAGLLLLLSLNYPFFIAQRIYAQGQDYRISANVFPVSPFFRSLQAMPDDVILVELPMGLGRLYNAMQLVHNKARTESMVEVVGTERESRIAPAWCYQDPLLKALWSWQAALFAKDETLPELEPSVIRAASERGLRYIVYHLEAFRISERSMERPARYREALGVLLGPPSFEDSQVVVWELDSTSPTGLKASPPAELKERLPAGQN